MKLEDLQKLNDEYIHLIKEVRKDRDRAAGPLYPAIGGFYVVKEWDDTRSEVKVLSVDTEKELVVMQYREGDTHEVSAQYFESICVGPMLTGYTDPTSGRYTSHNNTW